MNEYFHSILGKIQELQNLRTGAILFERKRCQNQNVSIKKINHLDSVKQTVLLKSIQETNKS